MPPKCRLATKHPHSRLCLPFCVCHCDHTGPLRHATGFPGLGLLRVLRPTPARSAGRALSRTSRRWPRRHLRQNRDGSHVHSRTLRRDRHPVMPQHLRHGYAAGLHRGLPTGDITRSRSSPHRRSSEGARCNPTRIRQIRVGGLLLRGFQSLVPIRMPLRLASRARTIWQYWIRLVVVEDCSTHHAHASAVDRPPAITRLLRQAPSGVLSPPQGSGTPRGARYP